MKKRIAIVGSGYIGQALARLLKKEGFFVTLTTRFTEKISLLKQITDQVFLLQANKQESFSQLIRDHDCLVLTIAPDATADYTSTYLDTAKLILNTAKSLVQNRQLVYTSSTSVYSENGGGVVKESSPLIQEPGNALILKKTEETLLNLQNYGWRVCIFRLSEIYGPGREILERVKKHSSSINGKRIANMIHLNDITQAILFALKQSLQGIFNLSDDEIITKKDLYEKVCDHYDLPHPIWELSFSENKHGGNKIVSNEKIKDAGFCFQHPRKEF